MNKKRRKLNSTKGGASGENRDVLVLSPYHGGSHLAWAIGLQNHSNHNLELFTMPDRFWKWRMHGGAITLAREFYSSGIEFDCLLATDMLDLASFLAITRRRTGDIPVILYMHENQLTYPLPEDPRQGAMRRQLGERDMHYAFINLTSMLSADIVLFNSKFHHREFLRALPNFLKHFPDFNEMKVLDSLEEKSQVVPVGIDLRSLDASQSTGDSDKPPMILWNHRWEYDKDPSRFFDALYKIDDLQIPFRLALCGRNYRRVPSEFEIALERLSSHIIHSGFADEELYGQLLWEASVVVSTARHEFFGVSAVEAIYCNSFPILPNALSYPELIPSDLHPYCLYNSDDELVALLSRVLLQPESVKDMKCRLSHEVSKYEWAEIAHLYDDVINRTCEQF
jgi:glycosyltransferase involved in cell wall biosynthesis